MKLHKEQLWILLAVVTAPFYFVSCRIIEVKDGVVYAYKTSWWCKRERVGSLKTSCVGEVRIKWSRGVVCVIEVFDN